MDLYSAALALAIAAVVAGAAAAAAGVIAARRGPGDRSSALARLSGRLALAGAALGAFSLLYHLSTGHRPGTDSAMSGTGFVAEHPTLFAALGAALLLLAWGRSGR